MKEYYTKSKKQELVEKQKNSGLSTSEWCKAHKIPVSTFYGWVKTKVSKKHTKSFLKLDSAPKAASSTTIIIEIRDVKIVIEDNIELLQRILKGIS